MYEDKNVEVKPSAIEGLGVFAKREFKEGETVLVWNPLLLSQAEVINEEKRYINTLEDGTNVLMNIPERYVNHSDMPNTRPVGKSDVAIRDIQVGEEITSHYEF